MRQDDPRLVEAAASLLDACRRAKVRLVTAESCTGGLIAAYLTEVPGSSDAFERGFVTYSDEAKQDLLSVPAELLQKHGAVSPHVARAMVAGALDHSRADLAVSVTGIAGPDGGTPTKPVGLVYLAACRRGGEPMVERHTFSGDRHAVRTATVEAAFLLLRAQVPA